MNSEELVTVAKRDLEQLAQQVHQAWHQEHECSWRECPKTTCAFVQLMVSGNYRHSIRPEVLAFAAAMESKLKENDWKGGWEDESLDYLLARLHDEMNELVAELHAADDKSACVCEEAVDVGAFAMMLHAKARRP